VAEALQKSADGPVLVVTGFGDIGNGGSTGGLFAISDSGVEHIDRISSMGLACDGRRLARVFRCRTPEPEGAEVVLYDQGGVKQYLRLDDAGAVHDVALDGGNIVVVSTIHNAVRWFSPAGEIVHEVRYVGPTDNWHVNCLTRRDGIWYVTMFGPLGSFGGSSPARQGAGRIVCLETGKTVVGGLSAPHTPRWLDGLWLVCDSAKGELLAVDEESGRIVHRLVCGDWTRGIAWDEAFLYVGASTRRRKDEHSYDHADVVVIDRNTWTLAERIVVPVQEIYDLLFVPPSLYEGARRGFDSNTLRTAEYRQYRIISELGVEDPRSLWPSGDPLPWSEFRCTIEADTPANCIAKTLVEVPLTLTNRSRSFFTSAPPAPVYVSYKWMDPQTGEFLTEARAYRTNLPRTVFPGETVELTARIVVPAVTGPAILRITPIQEGVTWFDDQDPANAIEFRVEVHAALPTVWEPVVR